MKCTGWSRARTPSCLQQHCTAPHPCLPLSRFDDPQQNCFQHILSSLICCVHPCICVSEFVSVSLWMCVCFSLRGYTGAVSQSVQRDETRPSKCPLQILTHVLAISESDVSLRRNPTWELVWRLTTVEEGRMWARPQQRRLTTSAGLRPPFFWHFNGHQCSSPLITYICFLQM